MGRRTFTGLVEAQQCRTRIDLAVDRGEDLPNAPRGRCPQSGFHLHAFQDHQRGTGLDLVAHRHRHGNNHGRSRGPDQAGLVLADAVTYAVHLDEEPGGARDRDDVEALVAQGESTLVLAEPFDLDDQSAAVADDPVAARTDLSDREAVGLALVVEFHLPADGVAGTRSTTACRRQESGTFAAFFGFVRVDRGGDERDVGGRRGTGRRARAGAVEPAGVGRGGDDLVAVEEIEKERLVGGASVDDDSGLTQGGAQPRHCFVSVAAPGDDLGDHRVVVGRDDVALRNTGVDADTGAQRELQQPHGARRGRKFVVGILGVEPGLDGVAELGRALALESTAAGDEDLQLDQVDAGGDLGDRVLDLQPGVDLEEREGLLLRLVEVLDGAGAAVSGGADKFGRHASQMVGLLLGQ